MKKNLLLILSAVTIYGNSQTYKAGTVYSEYYDVNPDTLLNYTLIPYTNETFTLNLFDGVASDIEFTARGSAGLGGSDAYIRIVSQNPNVSFRFGRWDSVYVPAGPNWSVTQVAKPLMSGDTINSSSAQWNNDTIYLTDHTAHGGGIKNVNDWIGGDKYIGLKYHNGMDITFGWIRINCKSADTCIVKDFSTGTSSLSIKQYEKSSINIFPNPSQSTYTLKFNEQKIPDLNQITVCDKNGKAVKFTSTATGSELKITLSNDLADDFYFLHYQTENKTITARLLKISE